jgi:hypothetical protein
MQVLPAIHSMPARAIGCSTTHAMCTTFGLGKAPRRCNNGKAALGLTVLLKQKEAVRCTARHMHSAAIAAQKATMSSRSSSSALLQLAMACMPCCCCCCKHRYVPGSPTTQTNKTQCALCAVSLHESQRTGPRATLPHKHTREYLYTPSSAQHSSTQHAATAAVHAHTLCRPADCRCRMCPASQPAPPGPPCFAPPEPPADLQSPKAHVPLHAVTDTGAPQEHTLHSLCPQPPACNSTSSSTVPAAAVQQKQGRHGGTRDPHDTQNSVNQRGQLGALLRPSGY